MTDERGVFAEYRRGVKEAFHIANMIHANRQGRTAEETCSSIVRILAEMVNSGEARAASTSANVAQSVSEKCARLAELYRDEHAFSGREEEICNAIAEACRDYGSANVVQGAEAAQTAKEK